MSDDADWPFVGWTANLVREWGGPEGYALQPTTDDLDRDVFIAMAADPHHWLTAPLFRTRPIADWYDDAGASKVVGHARAGNPLAREALRAMAVQFERAGLEVPPAIAEYGTRGLIDDIPQKRKRGRRVRNGTRDMQITLVIGHLERGGVPPMRNDELRNRNPPTSGASLVRHVLERDYGLALTEDAVEKVWQRRDKRQLEELLAAFPLMGEEFRDWVRETLRSVRPT